MPNALLVYPEHPPTYWGGNFALEIVGIKAAFPPLGLLTIAAMFPPEYDLRVVDMNATSLEESDLEWADMVFTSTMITQRVSLQAVIERCNQAGVPVVAGGPHPTTFHDEIEGVDHFVLDEAEEIFPEFLRALEGGKAKAIYREPRKPDVTQTPVPRFDLIDMKNYDIMGVQFSRGCPFDCEFCDITKLYGRVPRTKTPDQMVNEFELLYRLGWRGQVFLVDDNFIGNKRDAMNLLPVLADWQRAHRYPFTLTTEASVNLARMDELMDAMVEAGFDTVFLGIETPNPKALLKTKKPQNISKREENYLFNAVRKIQQKGMQVQGGFILGLDDDDEGVFDAQIEFIQKVGIPVAPIYMLTAVKGTDMYNRLKSENRILEVSIGGNAMTLNFKPEMDPKILIEGYRRVTATLYDPTLENYFKRCLTLFEHLKPVPHLLKPRSKNAIYAELMGVRGRLSANQVPAYMNFIAKVAKNHPPMLSKAIRLAGLGYHFEKITSQQNAIYGFKEFLSAELEMFKQARVQDGEEFKNQRQALFTRVHARYESIPNEFRYNEDGIEHALATFRFAVNAQAEHLAAM
ncbi:MAG: radical SAM protein [Gemmatimonadota bacterium]|nr:radical SAM protein [Gemmatimonadota bacterium]